MDYVATGFNNDSVPGDFNIQAGDHPGTSVWGVKVFRGTLELYQGDDMFWSNGNNAVVTADKAARYTHCVSQTAPGQLTLTQEQPDGTTQTYTAPGNMPSGGSASSSRTTTTTRPGVVDTTPTTSPGTGTTSSSRNELTERWARASARVTRRSRRTEELHSVGPRHGGRASR